MSSSLPKPDAPDDTQGGSQLPQELIAQAKAAASSNLTEVRESQVHAPSDGTPKSLPQASDPPPKDEAYVLSLDKMSFSFHYV